MHIFGQEEINLLEAAQDGKLDFIKQQLSLLSSKQKQESCNKTDYYGRNALHYASYRGHYEVVEFFLDLKCLDLNKSDNKGNSALMLVCVRGFNGDGDHETLQDDRKYLISKLLIQSGATLHQYQRDNINNPLHWACYYSDVKLTKLFLINNSYLMLNRNDRNQFPIDIVLMKGKEFSNYENDIKIIEYLIIKFLAQFTKNQQNLKQLQDLEENLEELKSNSNIEIKQSKMNQNAFKKLGLNYLFWASILGRQDLVLQLIKEQFSPFEPSYKGRNAVHAAAYHGHLHLIKLFFESEQCLNLCLNVKKVVNIMTIERPQTALHLAVEQGHKDVIEYLIKIGASYQIFNFRNHTPFSASRSDNLKKLKQSLLKETDKNLIRSGYKYVLIADGQNRSNLVEQQLKNIQEKTSEIGKFKAIPITSYNGSCIFYIIKIDNEIKNSVAHQEKLMVYNFKEGILCPFNKHKVEMYENFHHYHDQQIVLSLLYDEFNIDQFLHDKLLLDHFPIHDSQEKQQIYQQYKKEKFQLLKEPFSFQQNRCRTLSALQAYFGAEVGFFFVFLSFFTTWLLLPAIPGIMLGIYVYAANELNSLFVPIYTILLAVWATIFFEFWKRKQSETQFLFDMHMETEETKVIPSFKGTFWIEDVTHTIEIKYSSRDKWKYYRTITPLIILAATLIAGQQIGYYYVSNKIKGSTIFTIACSCGLAITIRFTNSIFNYFARISLQYENHQYQNELEDIYIIKVFTFAFLNSFGRLFYKAIIDPDQDEINIMPLTFIIVWAIIHFFRFTILPLIQFSIKKYLLNKEYDQYISNKWKKLYTSQMASVIDQESRSTNKNFDLKSTACKKFLRNIEIDKIMMPNPNYIDQFTYFIIQFCMVTMFSASSQLIPVVVLICNYFELDGLLYGYISFIKRPIAEPKRSIGLWNEILLIVGYIGTVINCLTIYQANQDQLTNLVGKVEEQDQPLRNFLLLIAAEHIVIGLKFIIETVIPDEPEWVSKTLKRQEYLYQELLNKEGSSFSSSDKLKSD